MVNVSQKTEQSPSPAELVKVFVGDSLLKTVLHEQSPTDPNKRVDWFIAPGAKLKDLEEIFRKMMNYYHSINIREDQLNIIVGVGYNDHRDYARGILELQTFVSKVGYKMAFIPPPVPREQKLNRDEVDYGNLVGEQRRLVEAIQIINDGYHVVNNCNLYIPTVKSRSKSHFAGDSYHFAEAKCQHIINHIRKVFSQNRVFDM